MKKTVLLITAVAAAALAPAALQAKPKLTGQQQLDKILEGRVAGKPISCITLMDSRDMQIIDKTAIVYRSGSTIYVNRTTDPQRLDSDQILVSKIWGSDVCNLDTIQLHERSMGTWTGFVGLVDFVPYRKPEKAN